MITKSDAILLLTDLQAAGIDCTTVLLQAVKELQVSLDTLNFINKHKLLDLVNFYEKIRKSYNTNKSKLYKNIMTEFTEENISDVLTTLNAYALLCVIFEKSCEDPILFERFARLEEVYKCLYYYSKLHDLLPCLKILYLIKVDIKALETIYRNEVNA